MKTLAGNFDWQNAIALKHGCAIQLAVDTGAHLFACMDGQPTTRANDGKQHKQPLADAPKQAADQSQRRQ